MLLVVTVQYYVRVSFVLNLFYYYFFARNKSNTIWKKKD